MSQERRWVTGRGEERGKGTRGGMAPNTGGGPLGGGWLREARLKKGLAGKAIRL